MHPLLLKSFLTVIFTQLLLIAGLIVFQPSPKENYARKAAIVCRFALSDFCLSTESRHTRHISMPEPIAPFQDLPAWHEHFPSSSFFHPLKYK